MAAIPAERGTIMKPLEKHRQEAFVRRLFATIANRYDSMNSLFTFNQDRYWRRRTLEEAGLQPGQQVLDVCCGTGKLTLAMAEKVVPGGCVYGLDFSPEMLSIGENRLSHTPWQKHVRFLQGNALHLPFADNAFDCTTIAFGLRNVSAISPVLEEMRRVTKTGGRLLALELSNPLSPWLRPLHRLYVQRLLPAVGNRLFSQEHPYQALPASLAELPSQEEIKGLLEAAGLKSVRYLLLTGGIATLYIGIK